MCERLPYLRGYGSFLPDNKDWYLVIRVVKYVYYGLKNPTEK